MADTRSKKTFLVGLRIALNILKSYVKKYAPKIKENAGEGLYAVITLILDLVEFAINMLEGNSDVLGNFGDPIDTLNSQQLNEIAGIMARFNTAQEAG